MHRSLVQSSTRPIGSTTTTTCHASLSNLSSPRMTWSRPDRRDTDWIKPSYIPAPDVTPLYQPKEDIQPLYAPAPEFRPVEQPEKTKEMPAGPKMPERRPDPIPAGNPKEKPGDVEGEGRREAPPPKKDEAPKK